jgi:hypothetical protein
MYDSHTHTHIHTHIHQDDCFGVSAAGAGGGGLMVLVTKQPYMSEKVKKLIEGVGNGKAVVHLAEIYCGKIL